MKSLGWRPRLVGFNYRAREGHDRHDRDAELRWKSFNYRAREGHDCAVARRHEAALVSTTVPAKGTTGEHKYHIL